MIPLFICFLLLPKIAANVLYCGGTVKNFLVNFLVAGLLATQFEYAVMGFRGAGGLKNSEALKAGGMSLDPSGSGSRLNLH